MDSLVLQRDDTASTVWYDALAWLLFWAVVVFVFAWLLPRKGVDFSDEGWYLQAALDAASGRGLNPLIPQAPHYLINAALMRLGLESYLGLRYAYGLLILLGTMPLLASISSFRSFATPLGAAFALGAMLNSLISYENAPVLLATGAFGIFLLAADRRGEGGRRGGTGAACLSGALLALAGFVNATTVPAVLFCLLLLWLLGRGRGLTSQLVLSYIAVSAALFGWYLGEIGPAEFFRMPDESHGFKFQKIPAILGYALQWPILFGLLLTCFHLAGALLGKKRRFVAAGAFLLLLPTCAVFFLFVLKTTLGKDYISWIEPVFSLLGRAGFAWIGKMPELLSFQLLLFMGFALLALALLGTCRANGRYLRILSAALAVSAFWFVQVFFSEAYISLKVFFAGPLLGVAIAGFYVCVRSSAAAAATLFASACLVLACCLLYAATYVHPGIIPISGPKQPLDMPRLEGILETPERAETITRLKEIYDREGCADKTFITFKFSYLLGYMFDRQSPEGLSYILPYFHYPEKRLMEELTSGKKWCVFVTKNHEGLSGWEKVQGVLTFLTLESEKIIPLNKGPSRHLYDDFTVYVGPREE